MPVKGAQRTIEAEVSAWEGVEAAPHRFGGREYRLGRREIGHLHGDGWADLPFPVRIRDELIAEGLAEPHHVLPESGWVTARMREPDDVARVVALFRRSYELALEQRARRAARPARDPDS